MNVFRRSITFLLAFQMVFALPSLKVDTLSSQVLYSTDEEENPNQGEATLDDAFSALKSFAAKKKSRSSVVIEDPVEEKEEAETRERLTEAVETGLQIEVPLSDTDDDKVFAEELTKFSEIKLNELPELKNEDGFLERASLFLGFGLKGAARRLIGKILQNLDPDLEMRNVKIVINGLFVPKVEARFRQRMTIFNHETKETKVIGDPFTEIHISAGAIAFSKTIDELAAQIYSAFSASEPKVYGFKDDEMFYRQLEDHGYVLDSFDPKDKKRIKQDLAAIERMISSGFRAEALTTFESRVYNLFLRNFSKKKTRYFFTRLLAGKNNIDGYQDHLFKTRTEIQKFYLAYIQKRKKTLSSFQAHHPFRGRDARFHLRMKAYVMPVFSSALHYFGPIAAYTLAPYVISAWSAAASYLSYNFGDLERRGIEIEPTTQFEQTGVALNLGDLMQSFISFGAALYDILYYAGESLVDATAYVAGGAYDGVSAFNNNVLDPWVWTPMSDFFYSSLDVGSSVVSSVGSWTGRQLSTAYDFTVPEQNVVDESSEVVFSNIDIAYEFGTDYFFEITLSLVTLGIIRSIAKHPQSYKKALLGLGAWIQKSIVGTGKWFLRRFIGAGRMARGAVVGTKNSVVSTVQKTVRTAVYPFYFFNGNRKALKALNLHQDDKLNAYQYSALLSYLKEGSTVKSRYMGEIPKQISHDIHQNLNWINTKLFLKVFDHLLLNYKRREFSPEDIFEILKSLEPKTIDQYYALFKSKKVVSRMMALYDLVSEDRKDTPFPDGKDLQLVEFHNFFKFPREHIPKYNLNLIVLSYARKFSKEKDTEKLLSTLWYYQHINSKSAGVHPFSEIFFEIFKENLNPLSEFIFSEKAYGTSYAEKYISVFNATKDSYRLASMESSFISEDEYGEQYSRSYWKDDFVSLVKNLIRKKDGQFIAEASRISGFKRPSLPSALNKNFKKTSARSALKRHLQKMDSITKIGEWVESEIVQKNGDIDVYSDIIYNHVITRPELIKRPQDIEMMLEKEFFWLQLPPKDTNVGKLEVHLVEQLRKKAQKHSKIWKYAPAQAEKMHKMLFDKMHEFDYIPKDFRGKLDIWLSMTSKGITSLTDKFFWEVVSSAKTKAETALLEKHALTEGRIWETNIASELSIKKIKDGERYRELMKTTSEDFRFSLVKDLVEEIKRLMPQRGLRYAEFLEEISVKILSSPREALFIEKAKKDPGDFSFDASKKEGENKETLLDENLRAMDTIFDELYDWRTDQVIDFVMYLRGAAPPSKKVKQAFKTVGPERVKRIFETLPIGGRWSLLGGLFTHVLFSREEVNSDVFSKLKRAILGNSAQSQLATTIIGGTETKAQQVAYKVLEAFLYAMEKTGNSTLTSYIFSYLLALPPSAHSSPGEILKHILETLGTLFVKFGQILAVTKRLPPEENVHLESLREEANIPERAQVYYDLADIYEVDPTELPFVLKEVIAGASIKYAALAVEKDTQLDVVLKVFRQEAINNRHTQYAILDFMAEYLIKNGGSEFLIFETLVAASKQAVEDEVDAEGEGDKSKISREILYSGHSADDVQIEVPYEASVNERLVVSAFAEGMSFDDLKKSYPKIANKVAQVILEIETGILFGSEEETFFYEPDRHGGNFRIHFEEGENGKVKIFIRPIDMGQLSKISITIREKIIKLFALSQILYQAGPNTDIINIISKLFDMTDKQTRILKKSLKKFFPDSKLDEISSYFSLLSAIAQTLPSKKDENGREIKQTLHRSYIDFIRGILQTTQYEMQGLVKEQMSPSKYFKNQVAEQLIEYSEQVELDEFQKKFIRGINFKNRLRSRLTKKSIPEIPDNLKELIISNVEIDPEYKVYDKFFDKAKYGEALYIQDMEKEVSCSQFLQ